jgi:hypothetical protein
MSDEMMDQGPNNSTAEHFKSQDIFSALVRESIQNSLDVPVDEAKPVIVKYTFGTLSGETVKELRTVEEHVRACHETYPESSSYQRMVSFLDSHKGDEISYLKVSDSNTQGMDYEEGNNKCGFYSFVQSIGNSSKNSAGSGGSFGFGKAAYYEFSNTRSILVSSKTQNGDVAFQGCSMLCTHKIAGQKYNFSGFFDVDSGKPIQDEVLIPEEFRRQESGSDIYLLHVNDDKSKMSQYEESIIRSVLLNFWMAIYANRLEVRVDWDNDGVDDVIISSETLKAFMDKYYPAFRDEADYTNPRPYYEAVKNAVTYDPSSDEEKKCVVFCEEDLKHVGRVKLYLMRNIGTRDRYLRMRKPMMVIDGIKLSGQRGISGVLICDGKANDFLSKAEPPAHDKWDIERVRPYKGQHETDEYKAFKAIRALKKYADECIAAFFVSKGSTESEITDLAKYLYATEFADKDGGNGQAVEGEKTGESSDKETGAHKTIPEGPIVNTFDPSSKTPGKITVTSIGTNGKNKGGDKGKSRTQVGRGGGGKGPHTGGNTIVTSHGSDDSPNEPIQQIKSVEFRSFAKPTPAGLEYTLNITCDEDLDNASIFISTHGAESDEDLPIDWSDCGRVQGNAIREVDLYEGRTNTLKFRFKDNVKHIISLSVYVKE